MRWAGSAGPEPYPCCGSTHALVSRILDLAKTHDIGIGDVESIDVIPHARRMPHTDNPNSRTPLEAKFSIQYCVACALHDRAATLDHFENRAENDPIIRALLPRINAFGDPDMPADGVHQWGAEVAVHTQDERRLASRIKNYETRGAGMAMMTREELWTKFSDCAARTLPRAAITPLFKKLVTVASMAAVTEMTTFLHYSGPRAIRP